MQRAVLTHAVLTRAVRGHHGERDVALGLDPDPGELRHSLGDDLPTECEEGSSEPCRVALYRLLRDELRASPGQELSAALLDAAIRRDEPDGEVAFQLVRERAHTAGGDAAWLAAVMELSDAVVVMAAAENADPSFRNRALARGLPSPCPQLAQTVPSMAPDAQRSALAGAEGPCALACPNGIEALRAAGNDDREAVIVRSCGPQLFGLANADDARFFADDPTALLALRGLTHTHEATRVLRERSGIDATRALLEHTDAALARAAIDAHVPARLPVAGGHLRLPVAAAEDKGRAPLVVVLGVEPVHLGARPWIGLNADGAPVRRGDAIPGPPLASTTDTKFSRRRSTTRSPAPGERRSSRPMMPRRRSLAGSTRTETMSPLLQLRRRCRWRSISWPTRAPRSVESSLCSQRSTPRASKTRGAPRRRCARGSTYA